MKLSLGSVPAITERTIAASVIDLVSGPRVSWCSEIGMTKKMRYIVDALIRSVIPPAREVKPTVGLMPATLLWFAGQVILPSVSVPNVTVARPIDAATADPEEEPQGSAFTK